jgi:uncharacterized coiled-coil DUF342 family protein
MRVWEEVLAEIHQLHGRLDRIEQKLAALAPEAQTVAKDAAKDAAKAARAAGDVAAAAEALPKP